MKIKVCGKCALADRANRICKVNSLLVDLDSDSCVNFTSEIWNCQRCGQQFLPPDAVYNDDEILCKSCAQSLGTCQTCKEARTCEFETNPDPMPKAIMQTIRQGNMVVQQQVRNPERMARYCPSCSCYSEEFGCLKAMGACGKWS